MAEVETYSLHKRLGFADYVAVRWILAIIVLVTAIMVGLLL